ncbi:hypothetical protein [Promicromonospora sukumoe]|uniref:hypothetical protein n=1 Tax=Promicromonospora sukumoe TaxID=88382 RepID=UPI003668A12A
MINIVILAGGNGAGKSTHLHPSADQHGIDMCAGHRGRDYPIYREMSPAGRGPGAGALAGMEG